MAAASVRLMVGWPNDEDAGEPRSADALVTRHLKANRHTPSSSAAGCAVGMGPTAAPGMLACMLMTTFLLGVRRRR
jgi:hypothetical protein